VPGLLAALLVIHALGYSASAWILGRFIMRAPSGWLVAFLIGWVILRVVALPDPRRSGLVRRGGVRPWCADGGHLASPDHHQPRRPSSRLMTALDRGAAAQHRRFHQV
jgi:hypothetical protein